MSKDIQKTPQIYIVRNKSSAQVPIQTTEMTKDYFEVGYILSGGRKVITTDKTYEAYAGMVGITHPYIYHKTVAISDEPYECILIRFTRAFAEPLIQIVGRTVVEQLNAQTMFIFSEDSQKKIARMFLEMEEEYKKELPYREFILQGMLFRLLFTVYEEKISVSSVITNNESLTPPIMEALVYIEKNFMNNPTLEEIAKVAGFSMAYFSRLFSAQLGKSYTEYLDNVKIKHAQILLTQTRKTIMEIAEETGYCHGNYLNSQFKKKVGMTPGQYRKKNRELA
ncbi:MAG: AraC family transcriptional regulator [Roseburia sp.]|nr:AraC family transcriptional regulator [Roseburia sp.]